MSVALHTHTHTHTFIWGARCSIIKNENGIKYENMKFLKWFFQQPTSANQRPIIIYYYYFTIPNVRKELRSNISFSVRFVCCFFSLPFLCSNQKSNAFTHNYDYYYYLLLCIWYSGREARARIRTCCYNDENVRASNELKTKKENYQYGVSSIEYRISTTLEYNENRKQKSRIKLNYPWVIYIIWNTHTHNAPHRAQQEVDVKQNCL